MFAQHRTYIRERPLTLGNDARRYMGEFHVGGFECEVEASGSMVITDTHARPIAEEARDLYAHAAEVLRPPYDSHRVGRASPAMDVLLRQAARAGASATLVEDRHAIIV
jgi:uncharacterized protein (UPF0276 family)